MKTNHFEKFSLICIICLIFLSTLCAQKKNKEYVKFTIYTGEEINSGTDMDLSIKIHTTGKNHNVLKVPSVSRFIDGNALERGDVEKFNYLLPKFADIHHISVSLNNTIPGWNKYYLKTIIITQASGKTYTFNANCWIVGKYKEDGVVKINPSSVTPKPLNKEEYMIDVKVVTGNKRNAGTNANVFLTLNTENKSGAPFILNPKINGNAFESENIDLVTTHHQLFSDLKSINIRHDNEGVNSGWYLEKVVVTSQKGKMYTFDCNCWLEGDNNGQTLYPSSTLEAIPPKFKKVSFESGVANKYLDVQWGNTENNTPLHLWPKNGGRAQLFHLEPAEENYFHIRSDLKRDMYLHIVEGSNQPKALVVLWEGKGRENTKWAFEKQTNGSYLIRSKLGTYLDVQWASPKDGTPIWMWSKNGGNAQQWKIIYNNYNSRHNYVRRRG